MNSTLVEQEDHATSLTLTCRIVISVNVSWENALFSRVLLFNRGFMRIV